MGWKTKTTNWNRIATSTEVLFLVNLDVWDDKVSFANIWAKVHLSKISISILSLFTYICGSLYVLKVQFFCAVYQKSRSERFSTHKLNCNALKISQVLSWHIKFALICLYKYFTSRRMQPGRPILFAKKNEEKIFNVAAAISPPLHGVIITTSKLIITNSRWSVQRWSSWATSHGYPVHRPRQIDILNGQICKFIFEESLK